MDQLLQLVLVRGGFAAAAAATTRAAATAVSNGGWRANRPLVVGPFRLPGLSDLLEEIPGEAEEREQLAEVLLRGVVHVGGRDDHGGG